MNDTFLACSCMSKLQSFWLFVYLCKRCARGYTRALRLAIDKVYCVDVSRWKSQSSLPQKIPLLVDFVFTLSTSTACDSGSGQYEAPAMRRMVTCSLSARPAAHAPRAWSPTCANTRAPLSGSNLERLWLLGMGGLLVRDDRTSGVQAGK